MSEYQRAHCDAEGWHDLTLLCTVSRCDRNPYPNKHKWPWACALTKTTFNFVMGGSYLSLLHVAVTYGLLTKYYWIIKWQAAYLKRTFQGNCDSKISTSLEKRHKPLVRPWITIVYQLSLWLRITYIQFSHCYYILHLRCVMVKSCCRTNLITFVKKCIK